MKRAISWLIASTLIVSLGPLSGHAGAAATDANRDSEAVIMTGSQFPDWSRLPAQGAAKPYPCGSGDARYGMPNLDPKDCDTSTSFRDAHNGTLEVPPDPRPGAPVNEISAYKWTGATWQEVPVQVDQRFPYFLANARSNFSNYSGTDEELTYQWDEESWKKTGGQCNATYDPAKDTSQLPGDPTQDPVSTFDDDDELSFMASDAGLQADTTTPAPDGAIVQPGNNMSARQEVTLTDPLTHQQSYVYLFLTDQGPSFNGTNGYVSYQRDANADQWIDRNSFGSSDPEILGSSHGTTYGPNLTGTVCDANGTVRDSTDRFPRDGMTVTTRSYKLHASGRWMVRSTQIAQPGQDALYATDPVTFGPDLIDRWKGGAFQQSPDSKVSLGGFEDEQVNWEGNSALLGERSGPVRAIREVWGADSGTNVTKIEYYYRDSYVYRYHLRVHPVPPDGLYTSWDNNHDTVSTYYDEQTPNGVPIDGQNDDVGNFDSTPVSSNTYFDVTDPTFARPLAIFNWDEVSGNANNGSLVYMFQLNDAKDVEDPLVVPYYRDDSCFDDGTGDDPSPRIHPGDAYSELNNSSDQAAKDYVKRPCYGAPGSTGGNALPNKLGQDTDPLHPKTYSLTGPWIQGCFGCHGLHFFFTNDTDNATLPKPTTEIDGQQYVWAAPTQQPTNVGDGYANTVKIALVPTVSGQTSAAPRPQSHLQISGDTSGQTTDTAHLSATLTGPNGPLAGRTVDFTFDGKHAGNATTDESGVATVAVTLSGPARTTTQSASYAGDAENGGSTADGSFEITHEDTVTGLTVGPKTQGSYLLSAKLSEADGNPLAGKTITFAADGVTVGTAVTDANGVATMTAKVKSTAQASFAGDDTYNSSSAQAPVKTK
ncbi:MAG: hypothetical protein ABR579_06280 [Actinomycetota bacterium]